MTLKRGEKIPTSFVKKTLKVGESTSVELKLRRGFKEEEEVFKEEQYLQPG